MAYDVGDVTRLKTTIEELGTATDPGALTFKIETPDGTTTEYVYGTDAEIVQDSTGVYYIDYPIEQPGRHFYAWVSTGTAQAYEKHSFDARRQNP